jgi:transcription initiation factor IIE alpha subunit
MADVPREAVQFARMAVRAFYSEENVVVVDAVLRRNNFCSHTDLARALHIKPKDLRKICARMVTARLLCSEKRQQRRINYKDSKHPARLVNTEFWYVPLCELVDAFQYRVHHIMRELDESIRRESEQDRYECEKCGRRYKLVDICANVNPETGGFFCDAMAVGRGAACNGVIREEDNSSVLKETENFKKRFEEELRPVLGLAEVCARMQIPKHPLEGADEATWALYVPETVGVHGEVVDAEGLTADVAAEVNALHTVTAEAAHLAEANQGLEMNDATHAAETGVIPERPDWFKDSKKDTDDLDDDWEDENDNTNPRSKSNQPSFGTGASFGVNGTDARSYLEMYAGVIDNDTDEKVEDSSATGEDGAVVGAVTSVTASLGGSDNTIPAAKAPTASAPSPPLENEDEKDFRDAEGHPGVGIEEVEEPTVHVQGKIYAMSDITDELIEQMSPDEYQGLCNWPSFGSGCLARFWTCLSPD